MLFLSVLPTALVVLCSILPTLAKSRQVIIDGSDVRINEQPKLKIGKDNQLVFDTFKNGTVDTKGIDAFSFCWDSYGKRPPYVVNPKMTPEEQDRDWRSYNNFNWVAPTFPHCPTCRFMGVMNLDFKGNMEFQLRNKEDFLFPCEDGDTHSGVKLFCVYEDGTGATCGGVKDARPAL